jgi:hypothetical protein
VLLFLVFNLSFLGLLSCGQGFGADLAAKEGRFLERKQVLDVPFVLLGNRYFLLSVGNVGGLHLTSWVFAVVKLIHFRVLGLGKFLEIVGLLKGWRVRVLKVRRLPSRRPVTRGLWDKDLFLYDFHSFFHDHINAIRV